MPSKEDICVVQETLPTTKKDFLAADVEELVAAIKHNLQLKAKPRHSACSKHRRMSPYSAPVRTVCRHNTGDKENSMEHSTRSCKYCILKSKSPISDTPDDPYEVLQELLREGSLIKEAVKRLQLDKHDKRPKKSSDYYKYEFDIPESDTESLDSV